jgi:flagellar motor protein MotB
MNRSLLHLMQDETYGPGSDLAMALVGILILYVAINMQDKSHKSDLLHAIQVRQEKLVKDIADSYNATVESRTSEADTSRQFIIKIDGNHRNNIVVKNKNSIQTIAFGDNLLFDEGEAALKDKGREVMEKVGGVIKNATVNYEEIQIQGHADIIPPGKHYNTNLELASARATTVFRHLQEKSGIDPSTNLMSIVSFGEFKPVQRTYSSQWNTGKIRQANDTKEKRDINRRIEILLIYN